MESDISHASDCVFYDIELREFSKLVKELYKVTKQIEKRAERRQTIQISKSLFDYVERSRSKAKIPTDFYSFIDDDTSIKIYRYKGFYRLLIIGFTLPRSVLPFYEEWLGKGNLYGEFKTLDECIPLYYFCVSYYLYNVKEIDKLALDEIPF